MNVIDENMNYDDAIRAVTDNYISTLNAPDQYEIETLKSELLKTINLMIQNHNAVWRPDGKWPNMKILPNACIASLILFKEEVRCISHKEIKDSSAYLVIYQFEGIYKGVYLGNEQIYYELVKKYKYQCSDKDVKEIVGYLICDAPYIKLQTDENLIAVNNGIFNFKTKELLDFTPDIVFTSKSRVNYIPNAVKPVITMPDGVDWDPDSWFNTLSDDPEIVNLLWEIVGAIIRPYVRWDKIVCFYSTKGMNGKGTLCLLMRQLAGEGSYAKISFEEFDKRFALTPLLHAVCIITDENGTTEFTKNPANLKAICTGDAVSIEAKYKDPTEFVFSGLNVQCVNTLPKFGDTTGSMYRRLLIVPFDKTFIGVERKYIKADYLKRPEVLEYILWKVLNMNYSDFTIPKRCEAALNDFKDYNDLIRQFWAEVESQLRWSLIPNQFIYNMYVGWMKMNACSSVIQRKRTVLDKLREIIEEDYNDVWEETPYPIMSTKKNMPSEEPLIKYYHMTNDITNDWSIDIRRVCAPPLGKTFKGFIRKGTS